MQYLFGSGVLFGRNTTAASTPVRFGGLQDVAIDLSFTTKELYGQYQFPLAIGRGTGKVTGKAKYAQFNAQAFNDLFFGSGSVATGEVVTVLSDAKTVAACAASSGKTNITDLGVTLASDGSIYGKTAATPVGLQYACNETTGNYTFNTSQNNAAVLISYAWSDASNGKKITITNQLIGVAPTFMGVFTGQFNSKAITMVLNACVSNKLTIATKLEDFSIPEFDFAAFADASNAIGTLSTEE